MNTQPDDWTELACFCAAWILMLGCGWVLLTIKGFIA